MKTTALVLVSTLLMETLVPGISHAQHEIAVQRTNVIAGPDEGIAKRNEPAPSTMNHAVSRSDESDVVVMSRGRLDTSKLTKGWYAHVVYTLDGAKRTVSGKTADRKVGHITIKSVQKPWKYWRIAQDDIEMLVTYKDRRNVERWLRTRPALLRLYENVLEIAFSESVHLDSLKKGSYAFVDYKSAGERRSITGKIAGTEDNRILIQSSPWKKQAVVHDQIEKLVVGRNRKTLGGWLREEYPKVRLKASSISRKWISGSFVGSTSDALELLSNDRVQRIPLSSIEEFEVSIGRVNHMAFGIKMGIVLSVALPVLAATLMDGPGEAHGLLPTNRRPGVSYLTKVALPIILGSTFIGYSIKNDRWVEDSPRRLNLGVAASGNSGVGAALTFDF